jgi:hypothetical protein
VKGKQPLPLRKYEALIWPHEELRGPLISLGTRWRKFTSQRSFPLLGYEEVCSISFVALLNIFFRIQTRVTENTLRYKCEHYV